MLCYPGDGLPAVPAVPAHLAPPRRDDRADGGHRLLPRLVLLPLASLVRLRLAGGSLLLLLPVQAKNQNGTEEVNGVLLINQKISYEIFLG